MTTLLEARDLHASYGEVEALHGIDFRVDRGEAIVIIGANGAGKTTTLRAICQRVKTKGALELDGASIAGKRTSAIIRAGVAVVPQGRGTLTDLSVEDNLLAGAYVRNDRAGVAADLDEWFETFPRLRLRRHQAAGSLSGGEQQMLAIARALMSRPRLLLLDEPSLGLAPVLVDQLFAVLREINESRGVAMVIVEQNVSLALELASRAYLLDAGEIVLSGTAAELQADDAVARAYLGYG
jgi:branched-chain amino acid transport system ATP-binding protein